ncbi:hypothetical protein FRC08_018436 [Ceratobasidium sp. 394]|nr:hypothetical protein FRC08_018436 [Ceratobasidium sp. 394]
MSGSSGSGMFHICLHVETWRLSYCSADLHDFTLPSKPYPPVRDMCRQTFVPETIGYSTIWATLMGRLIDNTPPTSDFLWLWSSPNLVLNRGRAGRAGGHQSARDVRRCIQIAANT